MGTLYLRQDCNLYHVTSLYSFAPNIDTNFSYKQYRNIVVSKFPCTSVIAYPYTVVMSAKLICRHHSARAATANRLVSLFHTSLKYGDIFLLTHPFGASKNGFNCCTHLRFAISLNSHISKLSGNYV